MAFRLWLQSIRFFRSSREELYWKRRITGAVGQSVEWELTPQEAWDLIALRNSDGWKVLGGRFDGLLGDGIEYLSGATTREELDYRRGFKDGIIKSVQLVDRLLRQRTEERDLIERAQNDLKRASVRK